MLIGHQLTIAAEFLKNPKFELARIVHIKVVEKFFIKNKKSAIDRACFNLWLFLKLTNPIPLYSHFSKTGRGAHGSDCAKPFVVSVKLFQHIQIDITQAIAIREMKNIGLNIRFQPLNPSPLQRVKSGIDANDFPTFFV